MTGLCALQSQLRVRKGHASWEDSLPGTIGTRHDRVLSVVSVCAKWVSRVNARRLICIDIKRNERDADSSSHKYSRTLCP